MDTTETTSRCQLQSRSLNATAQQLSPAKRFKRSKHTPDVRTKKEQRDAPIIVMNDPWSNRDYPEAVLEEVDPRQNVDIVEATPSDADLPIGLTDAVAEAWTEDAEYLFDLSPSEVARRRRYGRKS